jgi:hypothetical protein
MKQGKLAPELGIDWIGAAQEIINNLEQEVASKHDGDDLDSDSDLPPDRLMLAQNYPNPFSTTTTIAYEIPGEDAVHVELRIYDWLGRLVATLMEGSKTPGHYTQSWDGTFSGGGKAASGVYLLRLRTPDSELVKKMILVR